MLEEVNLPRDARTLDDYAGDYRLAGAVSDVRSEARALASCLGGRRVWMVNSTAQGGGVAEMLPRLCTMLGELGVETRWLVMGTDRQGFFPLTKRLHNLIHGSGDPRLSAADRALYQAVSEEVAESLEALVRPGDILVGHDPQPAGAVARVGERRQLATVWRCHIGLDEDLPQTRAAWDFLRPTVEAYDHCVFSAPQYIPPFLSGNVSIVYPALDPFSHKNRGLPIHKVSGILRNAGLASEATKVVTPQYGAPALRLDGSGQFVTLGREEDLGLLSRPIITQISRWDRLKGWLPLLEAFARMKRRASAGSAEPSSRAERALALVRLVLGGPEPAAVQDDPEASQVLAELIASYRKLEPEIQRDVILLSLPMASRKENALIVNALQRCSSIVVQNSLREGFGLTATEAMWKGVAVLGTTACGLRQQIRHGIDGYLYGDGQSAESLSEALEQLLLDGPLRADLGARGQRRVSEEFLIFRQAARWLRLLAHVATS